MERQRFFSKPKDVLRTAAVVLALGIPGGIGVGLAADSRINNNSETPQISSDKMFTKPADASADFITPKFKPPTCECVDPDLIAQK